MADDPTNPDTADCTTTGDACVAMSAALKAYNELMTGRKPVELEIDGETTKFNMVKVSALKDYIRQLHTLCPNDLAAAITGMPTGRRRARTVVYAEGHISRNRIC